MEKVSSGKQEKVSGTFSGKQEKVSGTFSRPEPAIRAGVLRMLFGFRPDAVKPIFDTAI
jgi:hypothetical protein